MGSFKNIFAIVFVFCGLLAFSQGSLPPGEYTTKSKSAIKHFEEGLKYYQARNVPEAEKELLKAIKDDDNFIEAHGAYTQLKREKMELEQAEIHYKKAIDINPKFKARTFYDYGEVLFLEAKYDQAKLNLETYLKFERINPNTKEEAEFILMHAKFAAEAIKKPKPFTPINIGPGINTENNEYFPAITGDGKQFLFTRGIPDPQQPGYENEDFYTSTFIEKAWQTAYPIVAINSIGNEGAPTLSADGNIMFFASCSNEYGDYGAEGRKGFGSCDIFYAQKVNGKWTKPRNAGPAVNTANWETQPSFSSDGKTLYFVRGLLSRGNVKQQDIYT